VPNIQQRGEFKWEIASTPSPIGGATRGATKERLADIRNFIRTPSLLNRRKKMRLLIVSFLMTISTVLAAVDIYVRLNPPKVETVQTEPAADEDDAPLMSGTKVKKTPLANYTPNYCLGKLPANPPSVC